MSASNHRLTMPRTYHHLMSRIAHKVFIMTEEERSSFVDMMRRVAEFTGIKLVAWCFMANHFHILAYLPEPIEVDDVELMRRYRVLKGLAAGDDLPLEKENLKKQMYSIGSFMKILKQWFTVDYNQRHQHKGTLWESVYKDVVVKDKPHEIAKCAAYIHLNPIRAAITPDFDGYQWSSFSALANGDATALAGMRMIYGEESTREEIAEAHRKLMSECLEGIKRERALRIAMLRESGVDAPVDHLTSEALVAEEIERKRVAAQALIEETVIRRQRGRPRGGNGEIEAKIKALRAENPKLGAGAIAEALGLPISTTYVYLKRIKD